MTISSDGFRKLADWLSTGDFRKLVDGRLRKSDVGEKPSKSRRSMFRRQLSKRAWTNGCAFSMSPSRESDSRTASVSSMGTERLISLVRP